SKNDHAPSLSAYSVAMTLQKLQRLVQPFRQQIIDPKQRLAGPRRSRTLFATLFPPEARKAIADAQRLLISPDGPLWEVPFAALVTNRSWPPHYLSEDKPIIYTLSLSLFAQSRNDPPALAKGTPPIALVVGDPIFDRGTTPTTVVAFQPNG